MDSVNRQNILDDQLLEATRNAPYAEVQILIRLGANPNRVAAGLGITPLCLAAFRGNLEIVKLLINCKAKVEGVGGVYNTPLIWAAFSGEAKVVAELIKRGANVNAINDLGNTALHMAVLSKSVDTVAALMASKTIVKSIQNKSGSSPLESSIKLGFRDITILLLSGVEIQELIKLKNNSSYKDVKDEIDKLINSKKNAPQQPENIIIGKTYLPLNLSVSQDQIQPIEPLVDEMAQFRLSPHNSKRT